MTPTETLPTTTAPTAQESSGRNEARKLNINISNRAYEELSALAKESSCSMTEVIRLGIALAKIAEEVKRSNQRIVIADADGRPIKELVLPR